jgi:DNA-binding LacI/PurR family transcriptional regulator
MITALAAEMGYVINATARNLRRQSSQAVGIVIPMRRKSGQTIFDPFFLEMVGAVSHAATKRGLDLIVTVPDDDGEIAERRLLQTGRADGLIIIGQAGRMERLNALGVLAEKVVVWGGMVKGSKYTLVGSDNRLGGRLATEHLHAPGRRTLAFIGDPDLPEVDLRYAGFLDAQREAGIEHSAKKTCPIDFGADGAVDSISAFLSGLGKIDGIVAASDVLAIAAMQALLAVGRRVPEDVSIVGYDNIGQAALTVPGLTTIDQNIRMAGEVMVDLLLKKLNGETVRSKMIPTSLIVRSTTLAMSSSEAS